MGLYLCVFDDEETDLEGVDVGPYSEWNRFVDCVASTCEGGVEGSRYPLLTVHSDSDGECSALEASVLLKGINEIRRRFDGYPCIPFESDWQRGIAKQFGIQPSSLAECFFDVDGENIFDRLGDVLSKAVEVCRPVSFQ